MIKHATLNRIVPSSYACYTQQGPGIGAGVSTPRWFEKLSGLELTEDSVCLDVGCGDCQTIQAVFDTTKCRKVIGVDIADACGGVKVNHPEGTTLTRHFLDVCHDTLPLDDYSVDVAFCTETIEHLANPYHMVAEVKRVLSHGGIFILAFPMPEDNLGYGGGQHAHVYPGFLLRDSFETFMRQMFFSKVARDANGSSAWYAFRNYKGPGIVDVFEVVSGNYDEKELYGVLDAFK